MDFEIEEVKRSDEEVLGKSYVVHTIHKLADGSGSDFEQGVTPDVPLEVGVNKEVNEITGEVMEIPDYSAFGNLDGVCRAVSGYFQ